MPSLGKPEAPPLDLAALRERLASQSGPRLWRSLEELADTPEVRRHLDAEFPDAVEAGVIDRRAWLRLMGASLALGGLGACDRNEVVTGAPLLSQPRNTPGQTPGAPLLFATSLELNGFGRGALVKSQEGRPVKIEGNPLHPASLGATDVFMQAEVLSLYDPDRSRAPLENGEPRRPEDAVRLLRTLREEGFATGGRGLHGLMPPLASATVERLSAAVSRALPGSRWHRYSALLDDERRAGAVAAFGRPVDCVYDLARADTVVTLGGDLFAVEPGCLRYAADYAARRRDESRPLPRLVAAETCPSLVGARADERLPLRPSEVAAFARSLAAALGIVAAPAEPHPAASRLAADLRRAGPRGLVAAGREQPASVHALAHAVNAAIGAIGTTVRPIEPVRPLPSGEVEAIATLADAIAAGSVSQLLVLGGNPAYDAPADLGLAALIRRVPVSVHLGPNRDETARGCRWHLPQCHALEAFGDLRAFDGTSGLCQPATARLGPGLSLVEALGLLAGQAGDERALVQATWRQAWGEAFEARWAQALEDGVVADTAFAPTEVSLRPDWDSGAAAPSAPIEVTFAADASVWDGRFANNGWLQELPKPLTKQVWGNATLLAPETAEALGLATGDAVTVSVGESSAEAPVWVLPGHAPGAVTLPLGYGRMGAGTLGNGIGFDAYALRASRQPWTAPGRIAPAGRKVDLVTTQHHHALEGRDIVRVVKPGQPARESGPPQPSLYPEWPREGHAWGMAIDLDACVGCNACVVACQAENNVAVVGPEEVAKGREMHWLRVDHYHQGDPANPQSYFQPVPCMQCEQAPCEVVCPVNATVHSSEGLNDMVYNRCIGTRTCSNNCPYKVRRFNFLDNRATEFAAPRDAFNPQVTVRSRGVMEKCTYCVQRISAARIEAGLEGRPVRDGEVVTACQAACPTRAITFGDVNDRESAVGRQKGSPRNYALLGDLNTRPRTTYLARIESEGG